MGRWERERFVGRAEAGGTRARRARAGAGAADDEGPDAPAGSRCRRTPRREGRVQRSLFTWRSYAAVLFGFSAAVTITISFLLSGIDLPPEVFGSRMLFVVANVFFISALATVVWGLYRRQTMQKPVKLILEFTERLAQGDFSARIPERGGRGRNEFDVIAEDLNRMAGELGSVEALRSDFVASVSHEMKTPLTVMSNYATIMQDPTLSEGERIGYAVKVGEAARGLSDMVSKMLRLNKLENQRIFPEREEFDLSEQLAECIIDCSDRLDVAGIDLVTDLEEGISVVGDAELWSLVWGNLMSNAVKFTPTGGRITVTLSEGREAGGVESTGGTEGAGQSEEGGEGDLPAVGADLRLDPDPDWATVVVADTGCGIPASALPHVFDKFYQADPSRSSRGNGLGLALVKRVVDVQGGTVSVRSEQGRGSAFVVSVPRHHAHA